jgi:5-methylcytosine-specific restriction endonuclease McrA
MSPLPADYDAAYRAAAIEVAAYNAAYLRAKNREKANAYAATYAKDHPEKIKTRQAVWYAANREKTKTRSAAWRVANPEKKKTSDAAWRAANPEKDSATRSSVYRAAYPEKIKASAAAWQAANPEKVNANTALRKARKLGNSIGLPRPNYREILAKFGMICHLCGLEIKSKTELNFDHVIPLAKGGAHSADNVRPSHSVCNMSKGSKILPPSGHATVRLIQATS